MKCPYCKGTGKYKKPNNEEEFEKLVDRELDKPYYVNRIIAENRIFQIVDYTVIDCPYCDKAKKI